MRDVKARDFADVAYHRAKDAQEKAEEARSIAQSADKRTFLRVNTSDGREDVALSSVVNALLAHFDLHVETFNDINAEGEQSRTVIVVDPTEENEED